MPHSQSQIGRPRGRRQLIQQRPCIIKIARGHIDHGTHLISDIEQADSIPRSEGVDAFVRPLDGLGMRRRNRPLPPHAVGAIDHQHHIPAHLARESREEAPVHPRTGHPQGDQPQNSHSQQHQQQLFQPDPPTGLAPQLEKLHRPPRDDIEPSTTDQMRQGRQRHRQQPQEHRGIQYAESHQTSLTQSVS